MPGSPNLKSQFLLRPDVTFLNFGSFGACPRPVFANYQAWQLELEMEPVQFITVTGPRYLQASRQALGTFIGCHADDVVFMPNPTYAINTVARSLALQPGDEILTTDLEYGAMDRTWNYYCRKAGAKYVRQPISLPVTSKEALIAEFWRGYSPSTKAIFISHLTSTTSLRLPVDEICRMATAKGLITIVDGAHAPAHIPLNLATLQADIYTGACHKWMLTPKGCSFLYVRRDMQPLIDPLAISWGYQSAHPSHSQYLDYHQMQGTRDFSAFLTVPAAIAFMNEYNWDAVSRGCRELARSNYERFCSLAGSAPLCPLTDDYLGQLCSIPITTSEPEKLKQHLLDRYSIQIPVMVHDDKVFLRYSIQAFNSQEDLDKLYCALQEIIATTNLLKA